MGHMIFVPATFASADNEPSCLFPHLWSLSFFSPFQTKTPLIIAAYKREEAVLKKKENQCSILEDKKLLGFNYVLLVAL